MFAAIRNGLSVPCRRRALRSCRLDYLDAIGMLASLGNRLILKSNMPSPRQIAVWDGLMVPISRLADPLFGHRLGKSVLGVWRRPVPIS